MPDASFVYPKGGKYNDTVNVIDQLYVTYNSQWSSLNLTLFCLQSATSDNYLYYNVANNPILANGTYYMTTIENLGFQISQYPVVCHYLLTEYQNNTNSVNGGGFNVTSTAGAVKTFQQATTASSTRFATQSATQTGAGVATTVMSGSQVTVTPSSTSSPTSGSKSGLSSGAAAGIGVGVSLGVVIIAAIVGFLFWSKRRRGRKSSVSQPLTSFDYAQSERPTDKKDYTKAELPTSAPVVTPIYESDSRPVERQELMAHEPPRYPTTDGRPTAEMP